MEQVNQDAEALYQEGRRAQGRADYRSLRRIGSELFEMAKSAGDTLGMARGHNLLGNAFMHASADGESAERYYRSAIGLYRLAGNRRGEAIIMMNLGSLALNINLELTLARTRYEEALAVFEEIEDTFLVGHGLSNLAEIYRLEGEYDRAFELGKKSLEIFRAAEDSTRVGWQFVNIAHYHLLRTEYEEAIDALRSSFEYLSLEPNPDELAKYFEMWFYLACDIGALAAAARLLGFLEDYRIRNDVPRLALMLPWFMPRLEKLEKAMPYDDFARYRDEGESMTLEQAEQVTYSFVPPS